MADEKSKQQKYNEEYARHLDYAKDYPFEKKVKQSKENTKNNKEDQH